MTDLILEFLRKHEEVKVPDFGRFYLKNSSAFYDEKSSVLLPPGKEINFSSNVNLADDALVNFISSKKNISRDEAERSLKETTDSWKNILDKSKELNIPQFGDFNYLNDELQFKGKQIATENPDNFGLEELDLLKLNQQRATPNVAQESEYKTSSGKVWWFLMLIPIAAIVYFALEKPELIFGKKSFETPKSKKEISTSNSQTDKVRIKTDSTKTDSISGKNLK